MSYNFIDKSALFLARSIRRHNPDAASEKALFYSLCLLINSLTSITAVLLISIITGNFFNSLTAIVGYTILRYFSGGAHMNSSLSCCIISTVIFIGISHIHYNYHLLGLFFNCISIIILIFTVPDGIQKVSRIHPKYYSILKIICVLIIATNFFIQSSVLSAAFITQALLTTKAGHQFLTLFERRLPA
jgi:accessory gene regulator B